MAEHIIMPIIHRNGDRPDVLMQALKEAYKAVGEAYEVLAHTAPRGRNYAPEPGVLPKAQAQYRRRRAGLKALQQELLEEYHYLEAHKEG